MPLGKVHWIGAGGVSGWQTTACGITALKCRGFVDEYDTDRGARIEAHYRDWRGVNCKRCLRNAHAPGNRFHKPKQEAAPRAE